MSIHLQVGKEKKVAVVFSCPGRHEEQAGRPAAAATGRNLDRLLALLAPALKRGDLARERVTITNAWPRVEYRAKTGRSEATDREVLAPNNLRRLQLELEEISDLVIFCGRRARAVAVHLRLKHRPCFVYIEHLGLRGLSLLRKDVQGRAIVAADKFGCQAAGMSLRRLQGENTERRLEVLAAAIRAQLSAQREG